MQHYGRLGHSAHQEPGLGGDPDEARRGANRSAAKEAIAHFYVFADSTCLFNLRALPRSASAHLLGLRSHCEASTMCTIHVQHSVNFRELQTVLPGDKIEIEL